LKVALFIPCYVDLIYPQVGVSVVRVLRRLGVDPAYPKGQTCCGQPAFNSGFFGEARGVARHFMDVFEQDGEEWDYIVTPSGSCAAMASHYYPFLFKDRPERGRADRTASRVREFSDFLVNVLGVDDLGARLEGRAVFHNGCHQRRELGVRSEPQKILSNIEGLEMLDWKNEELCCGFGGTFAVKMPDVSSAMADEKLKALDASGADTLISCDSSCLMHLEGRIKHTGRKTRVYHLAEVLDPERTG
jgi:L-lactate dehydrogenase complex protein LldE